MAVKLEVAVRLKVMIKLLDKVTCIASRTVCAKSVTHTSPTVYCTMLAHQ